MPKWMLLIQIWYHEECDRMCTGAGPEMAALLRHLFETYDEP